MQGKTKQRRILVTLADKNYIEQAKQLFSSVYHHAGWKGDYMLLSHNIPEKDLRWFKNKGILIYKCPPLIKENVLKRKDCVKSISVLDKFYLFTPYFKRWNHIVFLDADIIVKAPLDELTEIKGFAAMEDIISLRKQFLREVPANETYKNLKKSYNLDSPSFNSGVFCFDTGIIKNTQLNNLKNLFLQYHQIQDKYSGEQVALNLLLYKKWAPLKKIYNVYVSDIPFFCFDKPKRIKGVLHFVYHKPWKTKKYYYKEWLANLKKSQLIDLSKRPKSKIFKDKEEFNCYSAYLERRLSSSPVMRKIRLSLYIDSLIGKAGIALKHHSPRAYNRCIYLRQRLCSRI